MSFVRYPYEIIRQTMAKVEEEHSEKFIATNGSTRLKAMADDPNNLGQVVIANNTIASHKKKFKGIAIDTVVAGDPVTVRTEGELEDDSFSFSNIGGRIFYDANGDIVETEPTVGHHIQIIGEVLTSKKIRISSEPAVSI